MVGDDSWGGPGGGVCPDKTLDSTLPQIKLLFKAGWPLKLKYSKKIKAISSEPACVKCVIFLRKPASP